MKVVELKCKACGGNIQIDEANPTRGVCEYCKTEVYIDGAGQKKIPPQPLNQSRSISPAQPKPHGPAIVIITILAAVILGAGGFWAVVSNWQPVQPSGVMMEPLPEEPNAVWGEFLMAVFHKDSAQITADELAQIEVFSIAGSAGDYEAAYGFDAEHPDQTEILHLTAAENWESGCLNQLTGLKYLDLNNHIINEGDLDQLINLEEVETKLMSFQELAEVIPVPEKIRRLKLDSKTEDLAGIEAFTGLRELMMERCKVTDLKPLAGNKELQKLIIEDGSSIEDFSVLAVLNQLQELRIDAETLKDISFINQMEHLTVLEIEDSKIISIQPLEGRVMLEELSLVGNSELADYNTVSTLSGLRKLTINKSIGNADPNLSPLGQLTELTIRGFSSIHFLQQMNALEQLNIFGCHIDQPAAFAGLTSLETLVLKSFWGDLANLDFITSLPNLKSLDMAGISFYGDMSAVFNIPNLNQLILNGAEFELDFTKLTDNPSLIELQLNTIKLYKNVKVQTDGFVTLLDYDSVMLDEHTGFLAHYPNLERLFLSENKLTHIQFATELKQLIDLDVSHNYITDVRPLEFLEQLAQLRIVDNPVSNFEFMREEIEIITAE